MNSCALVVLENQVGSLSRTAHWALVLDADSLWPRLLPLCLQGFMLLSRSQKRQLRFPSPSLLFHF